MGKFDDNILQYTGTSREDMEHMISSHMNDSKEEELNYPNHFDKSVYDFYEEDKEPQEAINYFYPGARNLIEGSAHAM